MQFSTQSSISSFIKYGLSIEMIAKINLVCTMEVDWDNNMTLLFLSLKFSEISLSVLFECRMIKLQLFGSRIAYIL